MKGMDMVLKSMLGVEPEELKKQVEEKVLQLQQLSEAFNAKLDVCIANQKMLYALMVDKGLIDPVEVFNANKQEALEHVNGNARTN